MFLSESSMFRARLMLMRSRSYQVGSSTSSSDTSVASVVRTDSIKVGLADDRSIFATWRTMGVLNNNSGDISQQ